MNYNFQQKGDKFRLLKFKAVNFTDIIKIKVVSFNLRHANDKDGNSVVERAPRLHTIIKNYSPDVIGFQELRTSWEPFLEKYFSAEYDNFF